MPTQQPTYSLITDAVYGYLRADPIPSDEALRRYYEEEFYERYKAFNDSSLETQTRQKEFHDWRWGDMLDMAKRHFAHDPERKLHVFEIGCGFCQALEYLADRGCEVAGVEYAQSAVDYARSRGLNVIQGGVNDLCGHDRRYDVVLLVDVLEHLPRPAETLAIIRDHLLAADGLLIIDVPNDANPLQDAAVKTHHLEPWWFVPPHHLNYFSPQTLAALVAACGFEVRECETTFPLELFLLMNDVYVGNPALGAACHEKRVNFERNMRRHAPGALHQLYAKLAEIGIGRQIVLSCASRSGASHG